METVKENWDHMAKLSAIRNRTQKEEAEYQYRIAVQNYFTGHGELPKKYVPASDNCKPFNMYARCPNPACQKQLPKNAKICGQCGARVCASC